MGVRNWLITGVLLCCAAARAEVAVFDPAAGQLTIPSVAVGASVYVGVKLVDTGGLVFALQTATEQRPPGAAFASYDPITGLVSIPLVSAGPVNYTGVLLRDLGGLRFEVVGATATAAPAKFAAPALWLDAWAGRYDTGYGDWELSLVDPSAPSDLKAVDRLPFATRGQVLRLPGAGLDPTTGRVSGVGTRHLVYVKNSATYRVTLDKTGNPVVPVAQPELDLFSGNTSTLASLTGDRVTRYWFHTGRMRKSDLTPGGGAATLAGPPGELAMSAVGWVWDTATGQIDRVLWNGDLTGNLYSTDDALTAWKSLGANEQTITTPRAIMPRGMVMPGVGLRRYDRVSDTIRAIYAGQTLFEGGAVDESAFYALAVSSGVARLLRCPDMDGVDCVALPPGAPAVGAGITAMTTGHLVSNPFGLRAVAFSKADGSATELTLPGFASVFWGKLAIGHLTVAGDRVPYSGLRDGAGGPRRVVGTMRTDGTDRREYEGGFVNISSHVSAMAAHRLASQDAMPVQRVLVRRATTTDTTALAWLDMTTGELGPDVLSLPTAYFDETGHYRVPASVNPYFWLTSTPGTLGVSIERDVGPTPLQRLDAYLVKDGVSPLTRLTQNVP